MVGLTPQFGQKINGIRFSNVSIESWRFDATSSERTNYLDADNGGSINGVTFENVTVGGKAVTAANSQLVTSGEVSNITFK